MQVSWQIDRASLAKLTKELTDIPRRTIIKVARKGARRWFKIVKQVIKSNITWDDPKMKRSLQDRIVVLKKKRGLWFGVGIASGIKSDGVDGGEWMAARGRWFEGGYRPYPKGKPVPVKNKAKGRKWRDGLKGQGGQPIYATHFIERSAASTQHLLPNLILDELAKEMQKSDTKLISKEN